MSIQIGKFHVVTYQRRTIYNNIVSPQQLAIINHRLHDLTDLMQNSPVDWYLVGGLGTALTQGQITRNHGDVDIQVFTPDAPALVDYMNQHNYSLFQKIVSTNISKRERMTIYKDIAHEEVNEQSKRLRFLKTKKGRILSNMQEPILPFIDLFLATEHDDKSVSTCYKGEEIKLNVQYTNPSLTYTINGQQIKLAHPAYHAAIVKKSSGKKNTMNKKVLDELLNDPRFQL